MTRYKPYFNTNGYSRPRTQEIVEANGILVMEEDLE